LYESIPIQIGKTVAQDITLKASLETNIYKGQKVKLSLGPFPIQSGDKYQSRLNIVPSEEMGKIQ